MGLTLVASNIYKYYGQTQVLSGCSLSIKKNGVYIITGPNGSGKSTLLRILALLEDPDYGEITYLKEDNEPHQKDIGLRRKITLVLADVGIFDTTVFENVAYGLKIRGLTKSEIRLKVESALDFVGLLHKRRQAAKTLSSGEAKRMGIARAIAIEPEILFLDEPTAFVDLENTKVIQEIILNLKEKYGCSIVIATHDQSFAKDAGDMVFRLEHGRLI